MNVIVGLGNPGHTFHDTRHNAGFLVVEILAKRHEVSMTQRLVSAADGRPAAVCGDYELSGKPVRLMMPLTMMNESGEALIASGVQASQILIVCDDVNLPVGSLRLRMQGSPGGHNGLASCLTALKTEDVARLRIGVGTVPLPSNLREFVLSPVASADRPVWKNALEQAADACELWATSGIEAAMNRYNSSPVSS